MANQKQTGGASVPIGSFALWDKSVAAVKRNLKVFIVMSLPALLSGLSSMVPKPAEQSRASTISENVSSLPVGAVTAIVGMSLLGVAVFIVIGALYQAAVTGMELESAKAKTVTFNQLWEFAKKYAVRLVGLGLLVGLVVVVGLILLIIPGLIMIRRYFLSPYVLIDKDVGVVEAMRLSAAMSKPFSGYIWGVIGVMILIAFTSVVPLLGGLISAVLGMFYSVAPALRYLELRKLTSH